MVNVAGDVVVIKKARFTCIQAHLVFCSKVFGQEGRGKWKGEAKKTKERRPGAHGPFVQV